jgi:hypothetical protein
MSVVLNTTFGAFGKTSYLDSTPLERDPEETINANLAGMPVIDTTHSEAFLTNARNVLGAFEYREYTDCSASVIPETYGYPPKQLVDAVCNTYRRTQVLTNIDLRDALLTATRDLDSVFQGNDWEAVTDELLGRMPFEVSGQLPFKSSEWLLRNAMQLMRAQPYCTTEREELVTRNLVFFDDAAYSGLQAANTLKGIIQDRRSGETWTNLYVVVLFSTTKARNAIEKKFKKYGFRQAPPGDRWTTWTDAPYEGRAATRTIHMFKSHHIPNFTTILEEELLKMNIVDPEGSISDTIDDLLGRPGGLTLFEHKLPDSVSFPLDLAEAVEDLVYPNGVTPPYKDQTKFDFDAHRTVLQCAADARAHKHSENACTAFTTGNLRKVTADELARRLGTALHTGTSGAVFEDAEDASRIIKQRGWFEMEPAFEACVAAGKGVAPTFHDAFRSPDGTTVYLVTDKPAQTLREYLATFDGGGVTTRRVAARWQALDAALAAFFTKFKKARVCHLALDSTNVLVQETAAGPKITVTGWDTNVAEQVLTSAKRSCAHADALSVSTAVRKLETSQFAALEMELEVAAAHLPLALTWLRSEVAMDTHNAPRGDNLVKAVRRNSPARVQAFLDSGVDINQMMDEGNNGGVSFALRTAILNTPNCNAARRVLVDWFDAHLEVDPNGPAEYTGPSLLVLATEKRDDEMIRLLVRGHYYHATHGDV